MRTSALKGIAFLYFRAGDRDAALSHLERALEVDPEDATIMQAISRLGAAGEAPPLLPPAEADTTPAELVPPATRSAHGLFEEMDGGEQGLLLVDGNGLRLGGRLAGEEGDAAGDRVAAQLAGVSREAARATRLLGLGSWHSIAVESPDGHLVLAQPTPDSVLLATRDPSLPMGRVTLLAERAARAARSWLEAQT
jgi:predicted regulator of Ras-like GTPase activity (Roadblock/LC7/MglB family)